MQVTLSQLPLLEEALSKIPRIDAFILKSGGAGGNVFWVSFWGKRQSQSCFSFFLALLSVMPFARCVGSNWELVQKVQALHVFHATELNLATQCSALSKANRD